MRKFLFMIMFTVCLAASAQSSTVEQIGHVVTNSVGTVYDDGKSLIDTLHSDAKQIVSTVYQDSKSGFSEIYPDVKSAVVSIGKAIGVAAEHVYVVLVKKYFVLGIKQAAVFLLGLSLFIFGLVRWNKVAENNAFNYRMVLPFFFMLIGGIVVSKVNYDDMLMGLINPEYGAINYILEYTKDLMK